MGHQGQCLEKTSHLYQDRAPSRRQRVLKMANVNAPVVLKEVLAVRNVYSFCNVVRSLLSNRIFGPFAVAVVWYMVSMVVTISEASVCLLFSSFPTWGSATPASHLRMSLWNLINTSVFERQSLKSNW